MALHAAGALIRSARPDDSDALFDICLRTAAAGEDASRLYSDPRLPGYVWAAAYGALEPHFAFLLTTPERAIGYVIGAPDSTAFSRRLDAEWWPQVRQQLAGFVPKTEHDQMVLGRINEPESHEAWLAADYPAHLHINILPEGQSGGWGRKLIETELGALKAAGVKGVHLGVAPQNARAIGFYRHVGFDDISRDGHVLFGMRFR